MRSPTIFETIILSAGISVGVYYLIYYIRKKQISNYEDTGPEDVALYNLKDCADENQESNSTVIQESEKSNTHYIEYPKDTIKQKKKKFLDRFKPMAKTIATKKILDEIENRDVTITINLWKKEINNG